MRSHDVQKDVNASYVLAADEREVLEMIAAGGYRLVAGATDLYATQSDQLARSRLIDISRVPGLRGIGVAERGVRIGAATTWSDLRQARLPAALGAIQDAARGIGSLQIQNRATIGGNLCNASPAADGTTALLALDAEVELRSLGHTRTVPLRQFLTARHRIDLRQGEMLHAVWIPFPPGEPRMASAFCKFGLRRELNISIASVAVSVTPADTQSQAFDYRIAAGSVAPTPVRLSTLEHMLSSAYVDDSASLIADTDLPEVDPIDDVRASAHFRIDRVRALVGEAIERAQRRLLDA